tara:strand:+ start:938 stop:1312 length:375 start_codon:yes stop_codon:yes gene_type:complete
MSIIKRTKKGFSFPKSDCEGVKFKLMDRKYFGSRMWISEINIDGKTKHLGTFYFESDAEKAYKLALICVKENRINDIEKPIIEQHDKRPEQTNISGSKSGVTHHTKIVNGEVVNYLLPYWNKKN